MSAKQANFLIPEELLKELRSEVPRGKLSEVVTEALRKELKRIKFRKALARSFGSWKDGSHKELRNGTDRYVRGSRKSGRIKIMRNG